MNLNEWLHGNRHLPKPLKDFHEAKELFAILDDISAKKNWGEIDKPNWIAAQIFVIDVFLWFMAKHGYTLQRVRLPQGKRPEFYDLRDTIEARRREQMTARNAHFDERIRSKNNDT